MTATLQLAIDCVTALWSRWYALPARSTRARLEPLRLQAAAALRDPIAASTAPALLLAEALKLPGAAAALDEARPGLAREVKQAASPAPSPAASQADRDILASLLEADDPFAAGLARLIDQPALLPKALEEVRALVGGLDEKSRAEAERLFTVMETALAQGPNDHAATVRVYSQTLRDLQAIRPLRILGWRTFLSARVLTAAQVTTRLGGGSGAREPAPAVDDPPSQNTVEATAAFFTDVHFPATLTRSRTLWEPLIVRLTATAQGGSAPAEAVQVPFATDNQPEQIEVLVTAPDFEERFGLWTRTLSLRPGSDSEPAIFLLRSATTGRRRLSIDFVHRGRIVASVALQANVLEGEARPGQGRAKVLGEPAVIDALSSSPPPPADLELRVVLAGERRLVFTLHSARADVGYHWKAAGEVTLLTDPAVFFDEKFDRLSQAAAAEDSSPEAAARARATVAALGEELWDELLPESFKSGLWPEIRAHRASGRISSLLITSDEPWIPWEMVKPYVRNEVTGEESSEPFWAEQFALARWLAGRGSVDRLLIRAARLVAPELDLAYVEEEHRTFEGLSVWGVQVAPPLQTRSQLQSVLAEGGVNLLHLATHAAFDPATPNRSRVKLADGSLTPDDLSPGTTRGLRATRPLVFMNACSVGRQGLTATGLGGWADKWVNTGRVGAFIGTLWDVNDRLAAAFAQHFYARLFAGDRLGEALRTARLAVRDLDPGNPTWLAYTLYGDPQSVWELGNRE